MPTPATPRRSPNILVLADGHDMHTNVVELAMRAKGHDVIRMSGADFPESASVALHYGVTRDHRVQLPAVEFATHDIDVVWNRRPTWSRVPEFIAAEDRSFVRQQSYALDHSLLHLLDAAFWANRWNAARTAELKPWQLRHAAAAGLTLPETLISNDPVAIREFIASHDQVIHKPLVGAMWEEEGRIYGSFTAQVTCDALPSDELLRTTAAIFQNKLHKQYEVRAQFFGATCMAVRIDSSQLDYGEYDWRLNQRAEAASGAIELPPSVYAACRRLMQRLGIVAGGFDFIVTPDDEWYFLEVNEAGQFLFVEQWAPELQVVDAFCEFLLSRDPEFSYRANQSAIRYEQLAVEMSATEPETSSHTPTEPVAMEPVVV